MTDDAKSTVTPSVDSSASSAALACLGLEAPVGERARPPLDEWAVRRLWEGIQRRRAAPAAVGERRYVLALAAFAAVASVLALALTGAQLVASVSDPTATATPDPMRESSATEPLLTREARPFEVLEAPLATSAAARTTTHVDFADGSSIEAAPGTRVEALASSPGEFAVALRRGRAQFRVTPGGPRRWRIEASHARVEVLGTVLWVESDGASTSVHVDVGRVLVRSAELPGGAQTIDTGQSLRLGAREARPIDPQREANAARPAGNAASSRLEEQRRPRGRSGEGRVAPPPATTLWNDADDARRSGQHARAATLLARLISHYPADSQVALAAFTLGVLQLDHLARPVDAADSFQRALELGIGAALREDAYLRWADALDRMHDPARLVKVNAEYARQYPRGRHRDAIERLARATASGMAPHDAP